VRQPAVVLHVRHQRDLGAAQEPDPAGPCFDREEPSDALDRALLVLGPSAGAASTVTCGVLVAASLRVSVDDLGDLGTPLCAFGNGPPRLTLSQPAPAASRGGVHAPGLLVPHRAATMPWRKDRVNSVATSQLSRY
jgi:hypothetical protein